MAKEKWFKLIKKKYSKKYKEWQWTYRLLIPFAFNEKSIIKITITDHYKIEHSDVMNNKKILKVFGRLNKEIRKPEPNKKPTWPDVYVERWIEYRRKKYISIFWFKRKRTDWLWIRNCYPD